MDSEKSKLEDYLAGSDNVIYSEAYLYHGKLFLQERRKKWEE